MRVLTAVAMLGGLALVAACGGGSDGPPPTPTPQPSGIEIWQRALAALDRVESVRATRSGLEHEGMVSVVFPRYGEPSVDSFIPWRGEQPLPLFPSHGYNAPISLTNVRLLGVEQLAGVAQWKIAFSGYDAGIDTVHYYDATAWIAQDSYLVSRIEYRITRVEGFGDGPPAGPWTTEYTDYRLGSPRAPSPTPTPTPPVAVPPSFRIEPASGPCDGEVRITGEGMQQNDRVSVHVRARNISELGEVEGTRVPEAFADAAGRIDVTFLPLESWCASPQVAVERTLRVLLVAHLVGAGESFATTLDYAIAPCRTLPGLENDLEAFCFNRGVPAATPTPD
jgi:hypothetical protein